MTSHDGTEVTEDLGAALGRLLEHDEVHALLKREALSESSAEVQVRVLEKAEHIRQSILGQVSDIPMEDELQWTLALSYMELKSQWLQRQVRVCYEQMLTGACNQEVAAEASMVSTFIALMEPLMDDDHLRRIQELFVQQTTD